MALFFSISLPDAIDGGLTLFDTSDAQERCGSKVLHEHAFAAHGIVEEEPAVDAPDMQLFSRGAKSYTLRVVGEQQHASVEDALGFCREIVLAVPVGDVEAVHYQINSSIQPFAQGRIDSFECVVRHMSTIVSFVLRMSQPQAPI